MAVDLLADGAGWQSRFQGLVAQSMVDGEKILFLKPATFMNLSGQSVGEAARFYKIAPERVLVFHDEVDLPLGRVRIKKGGGHGGHNGLKSLDQHITPEYWRVRIGVGRPDGPMDTADYVLSNFAKSEIELLASVLGAIEAQAPKFVKGDMEKAASAIALALNEEEKN